MKKSLILMFLMAGVLAGAMMMVSAQVNSTNQTSNECSPTGMKQCFGNGYKTCGNFDVDSYLEFGAITSCSSSETCVQGACVSNTFSCTDSDGGKTYNIKGTVIASSPTSSTNVTDFCSNQNLLLEYFCTSSQTQSGQTFSCINGCSNGACISTLKESPSILGKGKTIPNASVNRTSEQGSAFTRGTFLGRGWVATESASGSTCYIKPTSTQKRSLFAERSVSGRVVVTGDFTEESCNTACGIEGGMISYSGDKSCECNSKEVFRKGNQYCVNYNNKDVCGSLGQRMTTNDGMKVMMTKKKMGGMMSSAIEVEIIEPIQKIPKNSGYRK